jgi:serine/threonine-protein kinase
MRPGSIILTQEGMVFGTPEFMSPEQAQGKTLTPASDIYSLACILYEALTGKLPFEARGAMDYLNLHVTAPPIPLSLRVPGKTFPPLLDRVIAKALSKKVEDRYASAADFASALQVVLDGGSALPEHIAAGQAGTWIPKPDPSGSIPSMPTIPGPPSSGPLPPPVHRPKKPSTALLVGVAVAFLVVGAGLAIAVMQLVRS